MPTAPPKACNFPSCKGIAVAGSSCCANHQKDRLAYQRDQDAARRKKYPWRNWYKLKAWINLCEVLSHEFPLCQRCGREGSYIGHHKVDHRGNWDLFIDPKNIEMLCKPCHDEIEKPRNGVLPTHDEEKPFTSCVNAQAIDKALEDDEDLDLSDVKIPT